MKAVTTVADQFITFLTSLFGSTMQVVEMKAVTTSADIWSVGCLAIELLTGNPPYYDLQPMSALYNIVQVGCREGAL